MVLLAAALLLGPPLILAAVILLIFSSRTKRHQGGFIASVAALACAIASVVVTLPVVIAALTNFGGNGPGLDTAWVTTALVCVGMQGLILVRSIRTARRHPARRQEGQAPVAA